MIARTLGNGGHEEASGALVHALAVLRWPEDHNAVVCRSESFGVCPHSKQQTRCRAHAAARASVRL